LESTTINRFLKKSEIFPMSPKKRRERLWLAIIFALVIIFCLMEGWFFHLETGLPTFGNVLLFALINLNVMLLLLLVYLVLRSIVKLIFERKRNVLGNKLRTRLVVTFVCLTLIPTLPLFGLATKFISSSVDYWLSGRMEHSLLQAVSLGKDYLEQEQDDLALDCQMAARELSDSIGTAAPAHGIPEQIGISILQKYHLKAMLFFDAEGNLLWKQNLAKAPSFEIEQVRRILNVEPGNGSTIHTLALDHHQEGLLSSCPLLSDASQPNGPLGKFVVLRVLPRHITDRLATVTDGYEDFLQMKLLHKPLRTSHFITFSIVTLLVIFAAIWFAFFLAKNITVPIQHLVEATQSIAEGDLDVQLKWEPQDEIGMLVSSFNKMVLDLRESREQLANAYLALQHGHAELETRRRYMETVLKNIAAGVVSVDANGLITTVNKSAETMFGFGADQIIGRHYSQFLKAAHMDIVESFLDMYSSSRQPYLEQQLQTIVDNRPMVLLIKVSIFQDEHDKCLGSVIVFDDLTDLEKAQRMAAWREVARRIAHEIKNPLTPIQVSAQRLRRKYVQLMGSPQGAVLEECTGAIMQQVDLMKLLVNEFSNFARLPRANPTPTDLTSIVEESVAPYRHTYPGISFILEKEEAFPILKLDQVQFKQVMTNLLDNAVQALNGHEKSIRISLTYDSTLKIARLECADTGHGLTPEDKLRIFEPYFSTKEKGTGLGLAIVASIVADHNGFVRVRDNHPQGAVIVVELPG
jgi:two-component system nitrogen regulation sensor histidine kinase NtrY